MRIALSFVLFIPLVAGTSIPAVSANVTRPPSFAMCAVCHKVERGAAHGIGPNLFGIGGKMAGTGEGFNYSPAMKKSGMVWNRANLIRYLTAPQKTIPGNRMPFAGQNDPKVTAAFADYLLSLK